MPEIMERPIEVAAETTPRYLEVVHCPSCGDPLIGVPVLICAHCGAERPLRAFYYKTKQGFIAECIDLDLMGQGPTREDAIQRLQEAMYGYLQVAFDGGSTRGLVLRPSPLSHRVRYQVQRLLSRITGTRHQHWSAGLARRSRLQMAIARNERGRGPVYHYSS